MNEKLNLNDLAGLLAEKSAIPKKDADLFLREYFTLITETISAGESLKISGLGTFKSVWVEPRTSINVQTSESFQIAGRYKLTFSPEKSLREAINTPFSCFETVILNDDYVDVEPQEEALDDENQSETDINPEIEDQTTSFQEKTEPIEISLQKTIEEKSHLEGIPTPVTLEAEPAVDVKTELETNKTEDLAVLSPTTELGEWELQHLAEEKRRIRKSEKQNSVLKGVAITLLICCIAAIGIVLYLIYEQNKIFRGEAEDSIAAVTETEKTVSMDSLIEESDSNALVIQPQVDTVVLEKTLEPVVETISEGVFLTKLALKHFGHKAFWVYIYEENKTRIPNPDAIPIGTKLVIPPKSKYNIDAGDTSSIQKAKDLAAEIKAQKL